MQISPILWLAAAVGFLALEASTFNMTSIWFAIGSAAALLCCVFTGSFRVQAVVFLVVSILCLGIAVDSMFYRSMKTLRDLFGYREIHIRHPQGQHICRLSSLHRKIIFQTIRSLPVRNLIKIVSSHTNSLTFRQSANFLPVAPGCRLNFIGRMHSSRPSARPDTSHRC